MDKTRQADLQQLRREYKNTRDPVMKKVIEETGKKIRNEDSWTKSAREALLRETRKGKTQNTKDIREDMLRRRNAI